MFGGFSFYQRLFTTNEAEPQARVVNIRGVANNRPLIKGVIRPEQKLTGVYSLTKLIRGVASSE